MRRVSCRVETIDRPPVEVLGEVFLEDGTLGVRRRSGDALREAAMSCVGAIRKLSRHLLPGARGR